MPFKARVLTVLIASPGDVAAARDVIERELHKWNSIRSAATGVTLQPRRWEIDGVPLLSHGDAQSVLNDQIVDEADIVIAVFHARLGSPTARGASGTAEEIGRASAAGKPVHVWFSEQDVPYDVDEEQLSALRAFRKTMASHNFVGTFKSHKGLRTKIVHAIEHDVTHLTTDTPSTGDSDTPRRTEALQPGSNSSDVQARIIHLPEQVGYSSDAPWVGSTPPIKTIISAVTLAPYSYFRPGLNDLFPEMRITLLGGNGSGKSSMMLAMYATLANGHAGFTMRCVDPDADRMMAESWNNLIHTGEFPPPTDSTARPYSLRLRYDWQPLLSVDILDYRDLDRRDARAGVEIVERLARSDSIYFVIDASRLYYSGGTLTDNLLRISRNTGARVLSSLLQRTAERAYGTGALSSIPPVVAVVTKADCLAGEQREALLTETIQVLLPVLFVEGMTTYICPVTIGDLGQPEARVDPAQIRPGGVHRPLFFSATTFMQRRLSSAAATSHTAERLGDMRTLAPMQAQAAKIEEWSAKFSEQVDGGIAFVDGLMQYR